MAAGMVEEVRTMKEVATLMNEAEFQKYLDRQSAAVENMKQLGDKPLLMLEKLVSRVTATAGDDCELNFSASQLAQIFALLD